MSVLRPAAATLGLIGGSAALVGGELRYRFPQDPLITLIAVAGIVTLVSGAVRVLRRRASQGVDEPHGAAREPDPATERAPVQPAS